MRSRFVVVCLVVLISTGNYGRSKSEPDYGKVSDGIFESEFFKFHYTLPANWVTENDEFRMQSNRKKHHEEQKKAEADAKERYPKGTTTTTALWIYDLLLASPVALNSGEKPAPPYIRIWVMERNSILNNAGDNANQSIKAGLAKVLKKPEELNISGHQFVHADLQFKNNCEASFDTISGKYLLTFEFRGKNEQEIDELAKTMESLKFD
jgi:hypothetical protein